MYFEWVMTDHMYLYIKVQTGGLQWICDFLILIHNKQLVYNFTIQSHQIYTLSSHSIKHTLTRLCREDQSLGHSKLTQNRVKISKLKVRLRINCNLEISFELKGP